MTTTNRKKRFLKLRTLLLILLGAFILIQWYRPAKNVQQKPTAKDFLRQEKAPEQIAQLFQNSCYNCHSNYTNYFWYDNIAPASWYVDGHITDAQAQLNFSNWGAIDDRSRDILLSSIVSVLNEERMPLPSYTLLHTDAKLSAEEKEAIISWVFKIAQ